MRAMHRALLVSSLSLATLALACSSDDGNTTASETNASATETGMMETGTDDTSTTGTPETDTDDTTPVEPIATLVGTLLDAQGAPLPSPLLQFCGPIDDMGVVELCIPVPVDGSDGSFEIGAMFPGLWSLKIVQAPGEGRYFTGQAFQLTVNEGDMIDLSPPIVVPEIASLTPIDGATPVAIDDVLTVTVDPAMAMSPDFVPPTELGGLMVPQEHWRVTEVEGSPVLAGWSFSPFGIKSTMGSFGFTVDGNLGLAAGEAVTFYEIEKDNGAIHEIATGTVNAEATAIDVVPTGEGLHELTWLLVTQ
jgi:hypothetical protein